MPDILQNSGDAKIVACGEKLNDIREDRNRAEYRLADKTAETEKFARTRLANAGDIIAAMTSFRSAKGQDSGRFEAVRIAAKNRADKLFLGIGS